MIVFSSLEDNFDMEHIYNPINSYNLVKRAIKYLPSLSNDSAIQSVLVHKEFNHKQISTGLYQIEEYSQSTPSDLIEGIVQATPHSKKYKSIKKLSLEDVLAVSNLAHEYENFDKEMSWLESALKIAEKKDQIDQLM